MKSSGLRHSIFPPANHISVRDYRPYKQQAKFRYCNLSNVSKMYIFEDAARSRLPVVSASARCLSLLGAVADGE